MALQFYKEQLNIYFGGDLDHHADSPNCESRQYGGNELPCFEIYALCALVYNEK